MNNKFNSVSKSTLNLWGFDLIFKVYQKIKSCSVCGRTNDLVIHHIDGRGINYLRKGLEPNNSLDNLTLMCHHCHNSYHTKKRNKERAEREGGFKYKGREKEWDKEWAQTHRESIRNSQKKYTKSHPEKRKELMERFKQKHPNYFKEYNKRYYQKKRGI